MAANPRDVLLRPLITEKTSLMMQENKYTFKVPVTANKTEIRQAVESIWNVKVLSVTTIRVHGKVKRMGKNIGRTSDYKKAIVRLAEGQTSNSWLQQHHSFQNLHPAHSPHRSELALRRRTDGDRR